MPLTVAAASLVLWVIVLLLPWRPWSTRERIERASQPHPEATRVSVIIPARDEAATIARTLRAVAAQGPLARIVLVDDQSSDGTAARARELALPNLHLVEGATPPAEWSGKLWALHQGLNHVETPYTLLLDADIELAPGMLDALLDRMVREQRDLVSVMARLSMASFWENLLIPPFIYFFKLIYPFALANGPSRWIAAAAGGCILVRTDVLRRIGGFAALRGALIDDCTLARKVKDDGGSTWLGLSHGVRAIRPYEGLAEIWNMVARTAFTQLRYSTGLLIACTLLMCLAFVVPVVGAAAATGPSRVLSIAAFGVMLTTYLPVLTYYRRGLGWLPTLPLAGALYLAMTWTSAWRYWRGERSRWKNRVYQRD
ncbi:MAG: glycosyltransferase [Gammaproteobacteria bacterium]